MAIDIDSVPTTLSCPVCAKEFTQTVGWLKAEGGFTCDCGVRTLVSTAHLEQNVAAAQKLLDDFGAQIGNLTKG